MTSKAEYAQNPELNALADKVSTADRSASKPQILQPFQFATDAQNQLIFFLKPEVFLVDDPAKRRAIVDLTFRTFESFGVTISGCALLPGSFLDETSAMDRHYGFINTMSRRASEVLSNEEAAAVRKSVAATDDTRIVGGHEYLKESGISAQELDNLWSSQKSTRVRSGLYVEQMELSGKTVVVVNGFHPFQLAHFTAKDRLIAVMLVETELPWNVVRSQMIGDTFPEKAARGSIRRALHDAPEAYGLGSVGITNNCVHLSAGPFEGYFEATNFLSRVPGAGFAPELPTVAKTLKAFGAEADIEQVLANPTSDLGSLFDATEGVDTRSAVALYTKLFRKS